MKTKTFLTKLAAVIVMAMMPVFVFSQNSDFTPDAAGSFSTFSMPQNLGGVVNSANAEELPVIASSGLSLYFASDRPGLGGRDIWVSQRTTLSAAWGVPQNVGALNSTGNEAPGYISLDGLVMFMNSTRPGGIGGVDIYISTRTDPNNDFGWTTPVNIGAVVNTTFGEQTPTYFVDPATGAGTLLFSSDRLSGQTNVKDIFQSTRNADGTFNPPTLVNELNSPADDNKPLISRDGLEIFFSSNRIARSIFVSTRASTASSWNPPVVVGSLSAGGSAAQSSLSSEGTVLYFASDRPGTAGPGDIYLSVRVSVNRTSTGDFDGDGRTDFAVFRQVSTNGVWYILRSSNNSFSAVNWGFNTDKPTPGDYDGDGRTDIAVYRDGSWYVLQSSNGQAASRQFGAAGDIPVSGANVQ